MWAEAMHETVSVGLSGLKLLGLRTFRGKVVRIADCIVRRRSKALSGGKMSFRSVLVAGVVGMSLLGWGSPAVRAAAGTSSATTTAPVAGEVQVLQQAYGLLAAADHDYQGHRARAMHAIEAACKMLGSSASGQASGTEAQAASDGQLQQAQTLLQSARASAVSAKQVRIVRHVDRALEQLSAALAIK